MFTGIVEEIGRVSDIDNISGGRIFKIEASRILEDLSPEHSIAVNGVCLTAFEVCKSSFRAIAVEETLKRSTLKNIRISSLVNLERAMSVGDRFGGHFVQGHVDTTAKVVSIISNGAETQLTIEIPERFLRYTVIKGSIALDGISLTVSDIKQNRLKISIIPYTMENTNLKFIKRGAEVNIEFDILGKYIENLIHNRGKRDSINEERLRSLGF